MQPPSLQLKQKQTQSLKVMQHLMQTQAMSQALQFLQLPIMELQSLIEAEQEQNPVLEYETDYQELENEPITSEQELNFHENDFKIMEQLDEEFSDHFALSGTGEKRQAIEDEKLKNYLDSLICQKSTLFHHLMEQSLEIFTTPIELKMAEALIGHFDSNGFLKTPLQEIALLNQFDKNKLLECLEKIKTLDPAGIGACHLQESLLLQLARLGKENTLAYQIIEKHYEDLLHNRIPLIQKGLKTQDKLIQEAISKDIAKLQVHPGVDFTNETAPYIIPDITIKEEFGDFTIFVNEDPLPPLKLNSRYLKLLEDQTLASETHDYISKKIASAKWLLKNLTKRNETLVKIAHEIVKRQKSYFLEPNGSLTPMTMQEIAEEIELHESTVARAVSNKYMDTPRGLKSLRSFFTNTYIAEDGSDLSSDTIKNKIHDIIKVENKQKPLSDEVISKMLEKEGIPCARRTVAKYRYKLNLGNAQQRKQF